MKPKKDKEREEMERLFQETFSFENVVKLLATTTDEKQLHAGHETFKALLPPAMHDLLLRSVNIYRELYLENQELKRQLGVI